MAAHIVQDILEIIECSICTNSFSNPKILPCRHVFCSTCLESYSKSTASGDKITCPLCRNEFEIPHDGIRGLRVNTFYQHLAQLVKSFSLAGGSAVFDDSNLITSFTKSLHETKTDLDCSREKFLQRVLALEEEIVTKANSLINVIENHKDELLDQLKLISSQHLDDIKFYGDRVDNILQLYATNTPPETGIHKEKSMPKKVILKSTENLGNNSPKKSSEINPDTSGPSIFFPDVLLEPSETFQTFTSGLNSHNIVGNLSVVESSHTKSGR